MDFSYSKCTAVAPECLLPCLGAQGVRVDHGGWIVVIHVRYSISTSGGKRERHFGGGQLIFIGVISVQNHFLK